MKQVLYSRTGASTGYSAASTTYGGLTTGMTIWSSTEANGTVPWPTTGTLRNLEIRVSPAPGGAASHTFTLRKNGVDAAVTLTITGAATVASDTSNSLSVTAGDAITIKGVPTGSPVVSGLTIQVTCEFESSAVGESAHAGVPSSAGVSSSAAVYNGVFAADAAWTATTPASIDNVVAAAGTITALYGRTTVAPGASPKSYTFTLIKNGTKQDGTSGSVDTRVTLTGAGVTSGSATFALSVAPGDVVALEGLPANTPSVGRINAAVRFVATTDGQSNLCGSATGTANSAAAQYAVPTAVATSAFNSAEASNTVVPGITPMTVKGLQVRVASALGAGRSIVFALRRSASTPSGAATCTITDPATSAGDVSSAGFAIDNTGTFDLQATNSSSGWASARLSWGIVHAPGGALSVARADPFILLPV